MFKLLTGLIVHFMLRILAPIAIAVIYILLCSLIKEPNRQKFNAIMLAGAGAAYLSGGFGIYEVIYCGLITYVAFKGLDSYTFIGIGWLLHTCWDILHHLYGNPILPFAPTSSFGCAIADPVIAIWFLTGAPSIYSILNSTTNHSDI